MAIDLEALNEDAYGSGYGEDGRWLPRPCVVCDAETQLRCGRCRHAVCHNCPECPNGCDAGISDGSEFRAVRNTFDA